MPVFSFSLRQTVTAHGICEVEAASFEEAIEIVREDFVRPKACWSKVVDVDVSTGHDAAICTVQELAISNPFEFPIAITNERHPFAVRSVGEVSEDITKNVREMMKS